VIGFSLDCCHSFGYFTNSRRCLLTFYVYVLPFLTLHVLSHRAAAHLAAQAILLAQDSLTTEQLLIVASTGKQTTKSNPQRGGRTFDSFQHTYEVLQRAALNDTDEVVSYHASQGLYALQDVYEAHFARALSGAEAVAVDGKKDLYAKVDFGLRK
jgi:hypothetical protein